MYFEWRIKKIGVCYVDWDAPPIYNVYLDNNNLMKVSTSLHIRKPFKGAMYTKCSMKVLILFFEHGRVAYTC